MHIQLQNITMVYHENTVLNNISLDIPPGQRVALIGPSGGGKSTMLALIRRDFDSTSGEILLDGINLKEYDLSSVLGHIGVVPQKADILSSTVRENVVHGLQNPELVSDESIWSVLDTVSPNFRQRFKKRGLDTLVCKKGMGVSGGEQQRLCVARALIEEPGRPKQLLIIDEATSSLDSETEQVVQRGIDITLDRGMGAIVIAHRFSTLRQCNRFVFLQKIDDIGLDQPQIAIICDSLAEMYECLPAFRQQADLQGFRP